MSILKIRAALEVALASLDPTIETAYENDSFVPTVGVPYQEAWVLPAEPENPTMGEHFERQRGVFFVKLQYPLRQGSKPAAERATLVAELFKRSASFVKDGIVVQIERTPHVGTGGESDGRWLIPIKIRWFSNIQN